MINRDQLLFSRQIMVANIGMEYQQKLLDSCVMIVGAGGLGCSVAQTLAGSGIGRLLIIDDDVVEDSNLPRQFLFSEADIGHSKAEVLCQRLQQRLSTVNCVAEVNRFSENIMQKWNKIYSPQVIIDAGDNLQLSLQLDKIASDYNLPLVHASVANFEGHIYVRLPQSGYPKLANIFPYVVDNKKSPKFGILSVTVAMVASYQATQVIRLLLCPVLGEITPQLVLFDGKKMSYLPIKL